MEEDVGIWRMPTISVVVFSLVLSFLHLATISPTASGTAWNPIEEVSQDKRIEYQRYPAIASDAGIAYASWADNEDKDYDIELRLNDGSAWQPEIMLNLDDRGVDQWYPDVAAEDGTAYLVWDDSADGDWDVKYRSFSGGGLTPIEEVSLDLGIESQQFPRIAVSGGIVHVVWQDGRDGDWDVYYRSYDGLSWSSVQEVSADVGNEAQTLPCVAAGGGKVFVVWVDAGGGDKDIFMRVFDGVSWGAIKEVSKDTSNEEQDEPDVSYDSGRVHIVWQGVQGGDRDIFYRSWDGFAFSSIQEISVDVGNEFQDVPSVSAEFGKVHVVWADRRDGDWDIMYRQFDGSSWSGVQELSSDLASENQWNPDVSTDTGIVHVVWEDQGDGDQDIYYRKGLEAPPADSTPPEIIDVLLESQTSQTYQLSALPPTLMLEATVDDTLRGNSVIGGANFTIGSSKWSTSVEMVPDDILDSPREGFHYSLTPPAEAGSWLYCVYGWDIAGNYNHSGDCAPLTISDDLPPRVDNVLIDGLPTRTIIKGSIGVTLSATLDDSQTGRTEIGGANYTSPAMDWPNSSSMSPDDILDTHVENFSSFIDTSSLGVGTYEICVYGWDKALNYNTSGSCASLIVVPPGSQDVEPPQIVSVQIDGASNQTFHSSSLPVSFHLSARIDDSITGATEIGGANYTFGHDAWPGISMSPVDGLFDEITEEVQAEVMTPSAKGTYYICVYGFDQLSNFNTTGACASLTILDDIPPLVEDVLVEGHVGATVLPGTVVFLTGRISDIGRGGSIIQGANYTKGSGNFPGFPLNPSDGLFDDEIESVEGQVDTSGWAVGTYWLCVYGRDNELGWNLTGSCVRLTVSTDLEAPSVLDIKLNGQPILDMKLSELSPITLTAVIDDSLTGNSKILGSNYSFNPPVWPGISMQPSDGYFDSSSESVEVVFSPVQTSGTFDIWVEGCDEYFNCGYGVVTLVLLDDLAPAVLDVLLDGKQSLTIPEGTSSVTLTAVADDSSLGDSTIGGANFTSPLLAWENSTIMSPLSPLDSYSEAFEYSIDSHTIPAGNYEIWVYAWDSHNNLNLTPSVHAILRVEPSFGVDHPPIVQISSVTPSPAKLGEETAVLILATDDVMVMDVWLEVIGPGGYLFDNISATFNETYEGYLLSLSFEFPGIYLLKAFAIDEKGMIGSDSQPLEVIEVMPSSQPNYKPALSALLAAFLILLGLVVLFRIEVAGIRQYWFLPFSLAEVIVGTISALTGEPRIPPVLGVGTLLDLMIFILGLSVPLHLLLRGIILKKCTRADIWLENNK